MIVNFSDVKFSYSSLKEKPVIDILNWSIPQGTKYFIYGGSGSGKSTLLNLLCGLKRPQNGSIEVLGNKLELMSNRQIDRFRAKNIGYIFQQFNLLNYFNAIENVQLAVTFSTSHRQSINASRITDLLVELGLAKTDIFKPVEELSVGQQQRVGIARALINKPKLLIADEPTSSLDESMRDQFLSTLIAMCDENKTTLVFVSHDKSLKKHFDIVKSLDEFNKQNGMANVY